MRSYRAQLPHQRHRGAARALTASRRAQPDTIVTTAVSPIAMLLLFVYVFGGAIDAGGGLYVDYVLPGVLLITVASGVAYTALRLFTDVSGGMTARLQSMPIARSAVLWAHVLTSLIANLIALLVVLLVALAIGFRSGAGVLAWFEVAGIVVLFTLAFTWLAVIAGLAATSPDGAAAFAYPLLLLPFVSSTFVPTTGMVGPVRWFAEHQGYRRYDAAAVVALIRIRTLADAGVPLSRVQELLVADEHDFAAAIEDIDRRLRAEIRQRQRHRERVAQLAAGDRLALPAEAIDYLDRLRELGIPERAVNMERDAWILVAAQIPDQMPALMALKRAQIEDPAVAGMYYDLVSAADWDADDPRLPTLADQLVAMSEDDTAQRGDDERADFALDPALVALLDEVFLNAVPIARRLLRLLEERGWRGWTQMERIRPVT
ncbi:MAG TPA: ABC transporter permease [Acidimicrobiales bacterium]|nr:ABC transporter permease [Acidimicrobiales bacterium]